MIKKSFLNLFLLLSLTLMMSGCIKADPNNGNYSLLIPIESVDMAMQKKFPLDQDTDFGKLHLSNPSIVGSKENSDKLKVKLAFNLSNFLLPSGIGGSLSIISGIRYDKKSKKLYLKNPMVESLQIQKSSLTGFLTPSIKKEMSLFVEEIVKNYPIYDLNKATMASTFVKDITIKESNLYLNLGL